MSNRRRVRKTYKQTQTEIEDEPEIIVEQLWSMSDWMEVNWRPVVAVLGAITLTWGGIGLYQILAASSADSTAAANAPVYSAASRMVYAAPEGQVGEDPNKPSGPTFATEKERSEAVVAAGTGLEGDGKVYAEVVVGAAKGSLGQFDAQLASLDAAIAAAGESDVALGLQAQRASALTAAGKVTEAADAWTTVATKAPNAVLKGLAQVRIGDLYNPRAGSKAADVAKAKTAYGAAIAALVHEGVAPKKGNAGFLHGEASLKLAQL